MADGANADELIAKAIDATGLDDFGSGAWRDGLEALVDSASGDAQLNAVGWQIFRSWVHERLTNRLRVIDWVAHHPEVRDTPVRAPLVVAGMLRTGTTILSELLAADPANRPLWKWEALDCIPPPSAATIRTDQRIAPMVATMEATYSFVPQLKAVHFEPGDGPTECVALLGQAFRSQDWLGLFHVPGYVEWYLGADLRPAYDYEQLALQVLQSQAPGRWSLKAPGHLLALDALFAVFPDTRLVVTHRDPVRTVASSISLSLTSRPDSLSTAKLDGWFEAVWFRMLGEMTDRLCDWRDSHPEATVHDTHFEPFAADPLAEVRRIYQTFDIELTADAEAAMIAHLQAHPRGQHGAHRYSLAEVGFTEAAVHDRFDRYLDRFGVTIEHEHGAV